MSSKRFIKRITIKTIIFVFVLVVLFSIMGSTETIISNYVAMQQMENSDLAFIVMDAYNNSIKPIFSMVKILIPILFVLLTCIDVYKFIQKRNKGEKNNEKL
jgi:hypothetical protein